MTKPRILFYDIETTFLVSYIWRPGKQVVRPGQLNKLAIGPNGQAFNVTDIICITYCFNDGKPAKALDWGYKKQDSKDMIKKFDEIIKSADIVIGKNSDSFDNKHVNTQRYLNGLPAMPTWTQHTDDLQKQMKRHFNFPTTALDYVSDLLGYGGKVKMEFQDWIDIQFQLKKASFTKMVNYGKKDVEDTRAIWDDMEAHFTPKYNAATAIGFACKRCGSKDIKKNGKGRPKGKTLTQNFMCLSPTCGLFAGTATIGYDKKGNLKYGKIG